MPRETEKLLRPREAAELLGVHPDTLRWWRCAKTKNGFTKSVLIGGQHRYKLSDVKEYIERNRRDASAKTA